MGVGRLTLNALWWSSLEASCPFNTNNVYPTVRETKESRHDLVFLINNQDVIHFFSVKEGYFRKNGNYRDEKEGYLPKKQDVMPVFYGRVLPVPRLSAHPCATALSKASHGCASFPSRTSLF
jgi:hypothetical protein